MVLAAAPCGVGSLDIHSAVGRWGGGFRDHLGHLKEEDSMVRRQELTDSQQLAIKGLIPGKSGFRDAPDGTIGCS